MMTEMDAETINNLTLATAEPYSREAFAVMEAALASQIERMPEHQAPFRRLLATAKLAFAPITAETSSPSTGQAPSVIGDVREAWLLAANVASIVRDEYYARSQEEGLSPVQRERYTYASTVAKQIKGEILAYAGIQEWPAPKPLAGNGGERASSDNSVATEPLSKTALSGSESTSSVVQPFQSLDELNRFALLNSEATPKWSDTPILAHTGFARMLATARERFSVNTTAGLPQDATSSCMLCGFNKPRAVWHDSGAYVCKECVALREQATRDNIVRKAKESHG